MARSSGAGAMIVVGMLAFLGGCDRGAPARATRQASVAQCTGTDPHTTHVKRFACDMCHPRGGEFGFSGTLPGGQPVSGTITREAGLPPSCTVSCHTPDGGTAQPVAWNAGPLSCIACHPGKALAAGGSAHARSGDRATCEGCHDLAQHMSGAVRLVNGMQPGTDAMCLGCHSGTGGMLANAAGPVLVGWQDTAGDWHGARTGTGYGGTLDAPYARGQASLPCATCHDAHASPNAFLLASVVNGTAIPAGTIDRAGVGAEGLCETCHSGDRHARCAGCHLTDPRAAGTACLSCHGHEGAAWFPWPGGSPANYHDQSQNASCDHCHNDWAKPIEYTPPLVLYPGNERINVTVGTHEATISWDTDEGASSFVEYGTTDRSLVAGSEMITTRHSVTLTGLASDTTYSFRVRSSDVMRNVALSTVRSFTTLCATCVPTSIPVANASFETPITATTEQSGAWWRDATAAEYCGTFASAEMTGANVLRIAATPREYFDDETQEFYTEAGYGTASYAFSLAALDAGNSVTFDVRPKFLGPSATVSVLLLAFDAAGATITDTANYKHVFDLIGVSSAYANSTLRIASPVVNTTYATTVPVNSSVANGLVAGKSWADVAKVRLILQATSGGQRVDVYFDSFR